MKRICRCGLEYNFNIELMRNEFITESGTVVPVKFCHECGDDLNDINLNVLLKQYFTQTNFMNALRKWDEVSIEVICLYRGKIHVFGDSIEYRKDFQVNAGMILEGEWYISKYHNSPKLGEAVAPTKLSPNEKARMELMLLCNPPKYRVQCTRDCGFEYTKSQGPVLESDIDTKRDIEHEIRHLWFKNHKATYDIVSDTLRILEWKNPNSSHMNIRYVMDGKNMYITGDLYSAVFVFTGQATLNNLSDYNLHYFKEKLRTSEQPENIFNPTLAKTELEEWFRDLYDLEDEDTRELLEILITRTDECSTIEEWIQIVRDNEDCLSELDVDYWEWIYDIGLETSHYIKAYLIGLKMAYDQIKGGN